jgi:hypothetical protein
MEESMLEKLAKNTKLRVGAAIIGGLMTYETVTANIPSTQTKKAYAQEAEATTQSKKYNFTPNPGVVIEEGYHPLPSTEGWKYVGEQYQDRMSGVPGMETLVRGYQKGKIQYLIGCLNGKPSSYWYYDTQTKETFGSRGDYEGDGNFEQYCPQGKATMKINLKAYELK